MKEWFIKASSKVTEFTGSPLATSLAVSLIVGWLLFGPYFAWSDPYQLFINTTTTIVTFLMVFFIQNSQNRDMLAIQLKLDALIEAVENVDNKFVDIEHASAEELEEVVEEIKDKKRS